MAGEDRTEKATPKKRRDERKKGNVFQSNDAVTAGVIAISFIVLKYSVPFIYRNTASMLYKYISLMETTYDAGEGLLVQALKDVAYAVFASAGLLMAAIMAASVILTGSQTRFLISREKIKFKFSKLNPLAGIKRMFSLRAAVDALKNVIKIFVLGYVVYSSMRKRLQLIPRLMWLELLPGSNFILESVMSLVKSVVIAFVAISAFDYLYERWEYEKNLRMTKQEVKEEYKQLEGDYRIKGKIKEKQRSIAMSRMIQQVPKADVIIRNPTHFAVAIKYSIEKDNAPVVLAKGQDYMAARIIKKAEEHNISIVENVPLARALYKSAEINREIPPEFYEPVAEVLAWVYRIKEKSKNKI